MMNTKTILNEMEQRFEGTKVFSDLNKAWISGVLINNLVYDHTFALMRYYTSTVAIKRLSGVDDLIHIMVPETLLKEYDISTTNGKYIEVGGDVRVYRKKDNENQTFRTRMYVFARVIRIYESEDSLIIPNANYVCLQGKIYKPTVYRSTPLGRIITDISINVPRRMMGNCETSDNIPCVSWGRVAESVKTYEVGNIVKLYGRIQSREYIKVISPNSDEKKSVTTNEISITSIRKFNI